MNKQGGISIIGKKGGTVSKIDDQSNLYNMIFNDAQAKVSSELHIIKDYNQKDYPFELREEPKEKAVKDIQQSLALLKAKSRPKDIRKDGAVLYIHE